MSITGSLRHLTELQVLMLQGNQLKHLTDVIHELGKMQRLHVLSKESMDDIIDMNELGILISVKNAYI